MSKDKVIVVGAGPTGLLTALGLARAGVEVTVLESEPEISHSPRAMVYHAAVLEGLDKLGVREEAERIGMRGSRLQMRVFKTGECLNFDIESMHKGDRFTYNLHLGQDKLAEIALAELKRFSNVDVIFGSRVVALTQDAEGVSLKVDGEAGSSEYRAAWVVGADGARSGVREALGMQLEGTTWPERFVATNIRYDFARHGYADATMQIDAAYGAIIARIDNEGLWRCTYSEDAALPEDGVEDRMRDWFKAVLPESDQEYQLVQYSPYRMHQRSVPRMREGRVLLAGDAAHITNPTGGLGLTSGLFDLYVLYEALAAVAKHEADASILDLWASERLRAFREIASPAASEFKRMVYSSTEPQRLEGDLQGLRHVATNPALQRQAFGLAGTLRTPSVLNRV